METIRNKISIIVPAFNAVDTILDTLNSVLNQTYANYECIIVNDESTDNTFDVVNAFIDNHKSKFKLINIPNGGVSNARNVGVFYSNGQYILPLDSDDIIENNFLEKCLICFNENQNLKLVYSEGILFGDDNGLWNLPAYSYKKILHYNMIGNSSMFLREDFERVGGYRKNMTQGLEDWDFWIALLNIYDDKQVYKIGEPIFHYRVSNLSRRLTLHDSNEFNSMLQNIVYNNFEIYNTHFSDIHNRIISFDYHHKMMQKWPMRVLMNLLNTISKMKKRLIK
jgi:glycosyltransferase involved in cell wall biosynthesis